MCVKTPDMKFQIKVSSPNQPTGWWEDYNKEVGQADFVPGMGYHPEFTGDINLFGKEIVDWFNKTRNLGERKRKFLEARLG